MFTIGQQVKVLAPFNQSFNGAYTIIDIVKNADETTVFILDQEAGGFDQIYLELIA